MEDVVMVTGGAGYIGSHTAVSLLAAGKKVLIIDNLSNSQASVIDRIEEIAGKRPFFVKGDLRDRSTLSSVFRQYPISSVVHFAGSKAVAEAEANPLDYYSNNVTSAQVLLEEMQSAGIFTIVFSSSATVYGKLPKIQYNEGDSPAPINTYGRTKLVVENILCDLKRANHRWRVAILRYFNPIGAHASGLIGDDPKGIPNNLMPFITQVAVGVRDKLCVFGKDYPTPDGTGLRDYIHVEDLAAGHLAALNYLHDNAELITVNLGTGRAYSVLELVNCFERVSGKHIPYKIVARRKGDLAEYYADVSKAKTILGWQAKYDVGRMCEDAWRWQLNCTESAKIIDEV